jgi:hypothetical protein
MANEYEKLGVQTHFQSNGPDKFPLNECFNIFHTSLHINTRVVTVYTSRRFEIRGSHSGTAKDSSLAGQATGSHPGRHNPQTYF